MKTMKLRSKRIAVPTIAAVAVLGVGGMVWSATASGDPSGSERDRVAKAAAKAVGGMVVEVETSDDRGEAYEVEVRLDDGTETDVGLDRDLNVVSQDADDDGDDRDGDDREADNWADNWADDLADDWADDWADDEADDRERSLSASVRASVEKAALAAVGGGTVLEVEASDDRGEAYEVELRDVGNTEWDVELDSDYQVLSKTVDD